MLGNDHDGVVVKSNKRRVMVWCLHLLVFAEKNKKQGVGIWQEESWREEA